MIYPDEGTDIESLEDIEEKSGKLGTSELDDKLMKSVLSNDKEKIDDGKLISESINQGLGSFTPDLMFKSLVDNYQNAKKLFGEKIIRQITGYDSSYVERNRKIPEFQKEMKSNIDNNIKRLKREELIDKEGIVTEKGYELSSVVIYLEEIEKLISYGYLGEEKNIKKNPYGDRSDLKDYKKGDRYKNINVRASIKTSIRRNHKTLIEEDLKSNERISKGKIEVIYALDASASMKGKKIEMAKKAGIALSFKAIEDKNKVGLIVFGDDIKQEIEPTSEFIDLLKNINLIKATNQTNIQKTILKAIEMFSKKEHTKHLILLTDALPTEGENPFKETLEACESASQMGITISVIGIELDYKGRKLAEKITELGKGNLHIADDINELDLIVLRDYEEGKK